MEGGQPVIMETFFYVNCEHMVSQSEILWSIRTMENTVILAKSNNEPYLFAGVYLSRKQDVMACVWWDITCTLDIKQGECNWTNEPQTAFFEGKAQT